MGRSLNFILRALGGHGRSKEQKRNKVRLAFLGKTLSGNGLKGSKSGIWETGHPGK